MIGIVKFFVFALLPILLFCIVFVTGLLNFVTVVKCKL